MADLLGRLYVEVTADTTKYDKNIDKTEKRTNKLSKSLVGLSKVAAGAVLAITVASTKAASDLNESVNAVSKVFGESAEAITEWGKIADEQAGLSQRAFNESSAIIGTLLKKTGKDLDDVAQDTIDLTKRSADLASVFNKDLSVATTAVGAALRGETEPIRQFGIDVSAAAVETEALTSGLVANKNEITEAVKVQARYNLIFKQSQDIAGDFADTNDQLANSSRVLTAQLENTAAELGQALLPAAVKVVGVARDLVVAFREQAPIVKGTLTKVWIDFSSLVLSLLAKLGGAFTQFAVNIRSGWSIAVNQIQLAFIGLGETIVVNVLGAVDKFLGVAAKLPFVGEKFQQVSDSVNGLKDSFKEASNEAKENQKQSILTAQTEITETQKATANKLQSIELERQSKINAVNQQIQALNQEQTKKREVVDSAIEADIEQQEVRNELLEEYREKLFELEATEIELIERERERELLRAEEEILNETQLIEAKRIINQLYDSERAAAEAELTEKIKEENKQRLEAVQGAAEGILSILSGVQQIELNNIEARKNADIEALQRQGLSKEEYEEKKAQIDKEYAKKEYDVKLKLFRAEKAQSLLQAGINVAQGITAALASAPPPFNAILAGITAAAGAVQLGVIASQPEPARPAFAQGGVAVGATSAIVGEDRGEVMFGMGAQGNPMFQEFIDRTVAGLSNAGNQGTVIVNFNSMVQSGDDAQMRKFARKFYDYQVQEQQRRGV